QRTIPRHRSGPAAAADEHPPPLCGARAQLRAGQRRAPLVPPRAQGLTCCPGPRRDPRPARHRHRGRLPQPSGTVRGAGARGPSRSRPVPSCPRRKRPQRPGWRRRSAAGRVAAGRNAGLAAMPKYYEDKEEDGRACSGVREDLRQCLLESPCVLQENKSPKQCLREGHCRSLQVTFFACKRSMLDTRARFRGRKGY
uniref:Cytochrome c oxidase assembly factor 5 n=1 Tax=Geospiza parvula TaxID=87175 RepID=A0A8C3MIE3_GEOPR